MSSPSSILFVSFVLFEFIFVVQSEITNLNFPEFTTLQGFGDVKFDAENHSWTMNARAVATSTTTCAMLAFNGKTSQIPSMQIKDFATGEMASFSTSFTFKLITPPQQRLLDDFNLSRLESKMSFILWEVGDIAPLTFDQMLVDYILQPGACLTGNARWNPFVTIIFKTTYNPELNWPSNSFIGITDGEYGPAFKPGNTYNLCGNNETHCSYLSSGESFTAWIDFIPPRTLQVRLVNGSHGHSKKPLNPLLEYNSFQLPTTPGSEIHFLMMGSSSNNRTEAHEVSSWTLYSSGIQKKVSTSNKKIIILSISGVIGFIAIFLVISYILLKVLKHHHLVESSHKSFGPRIFLYNELCAATNNFGENDKLGSGSFGAVYKGFIKNTHDGSHSFIAVKRINYDSKYAKTSFLAEISSLIEIQHGNVVQLRGWCQEKGQLLLVYDYMSNGSLDEWIHISNHNKGENKGVISLRMRHVILQGVGEALKYLHNGGPKCILHRDIKSSNILLDANFKAHLGDFGLARSMDHQKLDKTTMLAGTIGYMAPELSSFGKATRESDVYSFGILILEVVCGRRPLDMDTKSQELISKSSKPKDNVLLHSVWQAREIGAYLGVVDPRLLKSFIQLSLEDLHHTQSDPAICDPLSSSICMAMEGNKRDTKALGEEMIKNLLHLGLLCCLPNPKARPTMEHVVRILQQIGNIDKIDHDIIKLSMPPLPNINPLKFHL